MLTATKASPPACRQRCGGRNGETHTVLALFLLALHGGPLWQPLCYAQIGGLGVATFITLLFVPVLYSIFVPDLKIVKWAGPDEAPKPD